MYELSDELAASVTLFQFGQAVVGLAELCMGEQSLHENAELLISVALVVGSLMH